MNGYVIIFLLINVAALLLMPRRWAPIPFLVGACYIVSDRVIELGPFHFTIIRVLVLAGIVRVMLRGERLSGRINGLDRLVLVWSLVALITSVIHEDAAAAFINRLGLVYDICGIYFLIRIFCQSLSDVMDLCRVTAILLLPVALEMIYEKLAITNLFYALEGSSVSLIIREGHVRAQGPFAHAILAGTIGAVCLPLIVPLWRQDRLLAVIGISSCLVMVITAASSGPIVSMITAIVALYMWRYHHLTRILRWLLVICYIALDLIMNDPAYFLMARIDLAGGSTGYFRARLIQSAIEHLSEWWLSGTDITRHWMPSGVQWSAQNTDITNHYLQMGVWGGLPLMLLFIMILVKGFSFVGQTLREMPESNPQSRFMLWALGASLFVDTITFISVTYFDQSFVFIYLTLAIISTARSSVKPFSTMQRSKQMNGLPQTT